MGFFHRHIPHFCTGMKTKKIKKIKVTKSNKFFLVQIRPKQSEILMHYMNSVTFTIRPMGMRLRVCAPALSAR